MKILICNSGSSSLKFSLFEAEDESLLAEGGIDWTVQPTRLVFRRPGRAEVREQLDLREHDAAGERILGDLLAGPTPVLRGVEDIDAVAHRVVHGGSRYTSAVLVTPEVQQAIEELSELAPLHNPASLEAIRVVQRLLTSVPQVAVFDTAFHRTMPAAALTYPIPRKWTNEWGIRRYGFHGLSHAYCSKRAAEMLDRSNSRLVIAHLGNGASVSAVRDGKSVDISMGFTPLEGVVMGSRSGSVDPGLLIYLLRHKGLSAEQLDHALNHESGLLGLSGFSSDMRQILEKSSENPGARLALDVYVHRLRQTIGAMAATLGGVDALVFTAGVGENSARVRALVCEKLGYLDLDLDAGKNERSRPDSDIALASSPGRILLIATREDLTIMRETKGLLRSEAADKPCVFRKRSTSETELVNQTR
jgi:acetate kinase